jgi:hypothetical protein
MGYIVPSAPSQVRLDGRASVATSSHPLPLIVSEWLECLEVIPTLDMSDTGPGKNRDKANLLRIYVSLSQRGLLQ